MRRHVRLAQCQRRENTDRSQIFCCNYTCMLMVRMLGILHGSQGKVMDSEGTSILNAYSTNYRYVHFVGYVFLPLRHFFCGKIF